MRNETKTARKGREGTMFKVNNEMVRKVVANYERGGRVIDYRGMNIVMDELRNEQFETASIAAGLVSAMLWNGGYIK
jgi:hypothetical protein